MQKVQENGDRILYLIFLLIIPFEMVDLDFPGFKLGYFFNFFNRQKNEAKKSRQVQSLRVNWQAARIYYLQLSIKGDSL